MPIPGGYMRGLAGLASDYTRGAGRGVLGAAMGRYGGAGMGAFYGAAAGGLYGAVSSNTSIMGGALAGAGIGAGGGGYGSIARRRGMGFANSRMMRRGRVMANRGYNRIRSTLGQPLMMG